MKKNAKQSGFTLLETTIALSIFVVASVIITSLFIAHSRLFRIEDALETIKSGKTLFTRNFSSAGEAASSIVASQSIGGTLYQSATSTVIFKIPAIDTSGNPISSAFDYIVFYRDGENAYMKTEAAADSRKKSGQKLLSSSLGNLIFRYNNASPADASFVEAFLYFEKDSAARESATVAVYLRNK